MNILAILLLVWPAIAYGWISGKLLAMGPLRRYEWLRLVGVPTVLGVVYYLIYWREWYWLNMYPITLALVLALVVGLIGYPLIFLYLVVSQRDESTPCRLKYLALSIGIGLVGAVVLGLAIRSGGAGEFLAPWLNE